ncbi:3'(2'),5'-bisphosphate nucleotidase [hydrothermal vent metagenome]|uniref:3'(2'),5'-bisphosphate nucleotidase n=1 Tax=hydrothermal vent metagenome TaxID=652676 RepID=A0A3B0TZ18_9ZZZZ
MPLTLDQRRQLAGELTKTVRAAGEAIMAVYATDFTVCRKADQSPVTQADDRAEAIIIDHLNQLAPDIPVVAEEAHSAGKRVEPGLTFFLVDPLDGTAEFVGRRDEFTVNIALVEDGVPTLGLVFAPAKERLFRSYGIGEAAEIDADGKARPIAARMPPASGRIAVASRSHRDAATEAYLTRLGITEFISAGSSLKFCLLAAGEADIYPRLGPTCEWDTAAGHAVLLAAGGAMSTLDGGPFVYGKTATDFLNPGFLAWGAGPAAPLVFSD